MVVSAPTWRGHRLMRGEFEVGRVYRPGCDDEELGNDR